MSRPSPRAALAIACLLLPGALPEQQSGDVPAAQPAAAPKPCAAREYRQFDFWIGNWSVLDPQGKPAGTNDIQSVLGGCVVQENWVGEKGMIGTSLNIWDAPAKKWRQSWVDNRGQVLLLEGAFNDGKMVLEGRRPEPGGGTVLHRISWQRIDGNPNRVRQLWQASRDEGKSWQILFDGTYVRRR